MKKINLKDLMKNNRSTIMSLEDGTKNSEVLDLFGEDIEIMQLIKERDKNDNGKRYTSDDVIRMRNNK